jgi:tRNA(Met) cytidine acetyltransferase
MLRPLAKQGDEVYQAACSRLFADLPYWLADSLQDLDCDVAVECLRNGNTEPFTLNEFDEQAVAAFAKSERSYDDCSAALWRFVVVAFMNPEYHLDKTGRDLLVAKILQKRPWKDVAILCDLTGRTEVINGLRSAFSSLLSSLLREEE